MTRWELSAWLTVLIVAGLMPIIVFLYLYGSLT